MVQSGGNSRELESPTVRITVGLSALTAMEVLMDAQLFSPSLKKSVLFAVVVILGVVVIIAAAILLLAAGRLA